MWRVAFVVAVLGMPATVAAQTYSVTASGFSDPIDNRHPAADINGNYTVSKNTGGGLASPVRYSANRTYVGPYRAQMSIVVYDDEPGNDMGTATVEVRIVIGSGAVGSEGTIFYRKVVGKPVSLNGLSLPYSGVRNTALRSSAGLAGSQVRIQ